MIGLNDMNLLNCELYVKDIKKALENYDFSGLNGKRILVTGSTGLICSAIIDLLLVLRRSGIKIDIIACGRNKTKVNKRFNNEVFFLQYDAIAFADLPSKIDFIIHGAGNASPELYKTMPVETMLSNIEGVKNLLGYCVNNNTKMVYISSSEVYGQNVNKDTFSEIDYGYIDQDNIRNSYSEAKRASEMLCRSYEKEYCANVCIVRPGHIYGPTAQEKDKRISSEFAYKAANGEVLKMLSAGLQLRSYCYCIDCACAILICLLNGISGEAYNIGTKQQTSIREMALILANSGGVKLIVEKPSSDEKATFNPMDHSMLTIDKIEKIGYKQIFSPDVGLDHTVKIIKELQENISE